MNRKTMLLGANYILLMFGTTVYMGVLWALHYFWYPSWDVMNVGNVQDHFILPTSAATQFFTIIVPIMFLTSGVMVWQEWKSKFRWHAVIGFLGVSVATVVGWFLIIPVNKTIAAGVEQAQLSELLGRWMMLNDIRWYSVTIMWLALTIYLLMRPSLDDND